jgi:hypothetical protein
MRATLRLAALALGLAAIAPAAAQAKPRFPAIIRSHLGLDYDPPCRLCHIHGTTGAGSVSTPFGNSMLAHGMTGDESTIVPALDALAADAVDSDGDGIPDITELKADTDPNTPADVSLVSSDPKYGCSIGAGAPSGTLAGGIGVLLLVARRSRRR